MALDFAHHMNHQMILPSFLSDDDSGSSPPLDNHSSIKFHPYSLSYETCESLCGHYGICSWSEAARHVFRRLMVLYLRQPFVLALLPLVVGIVIGVVIGYMISSGHKRTLPFKRFCGIIPSLLMTFANLTLFSKVPSTVPTESEKVRSNQARKKVQSIQLIPQSGIAPALVPRHIAVIMDGNRRYGKVTYGSSTRGHWDGSRKLVEFSKWCLAEGISAVTVYAFSTENWMRDPSEVSALMTIFVEYCNEMRQEAMENGIRVCVLTTDDSKLPEDVKREYKKLVEDTAQCQKMVVNICLSYGSRGEIVNACRDIAKDVACGTLREEDVTEDLFGRRMLLSSSPDVVVRTSGEKRLSNFLLWQLAYAEMFFWDKRWPEVTREDLVQLIQTYAQGRQRRFGK